MQATSLQQRWPVEWDNMGKRRHRREGRQEKGKCIGEGDRRKEGERVDLRNSNFRPNVAPNLTTSPKVLF